MSYREGSGLSNIPDSLSPPISVRPMVSAVGSFRVLSTVGACGVPVGHRCSPGMGTTRACSPRLSDEEFSSPS